MDIKNVMVKEEVDQDKMSEKKEEDQGGGGSSDFSLSSINLAALKEESLRQEEKDKVKSDTEPSREPSLPKAETEASLPSSKSPAKPHRACESKDSSEDVKKTKSTQRHSHHSSGSSKSHRHRHSSSNSSSRKSSSSSKRSNIGIQCKRGESRKGESRRFGGFCMSNPCPSLSHVLKYKYGHLMRVEISPNGRGKVLHMWQDEIEALNISDTERETAAKEFFEEAFSEVDGWAIYCCAIVHGSGRAFPDFLEFLGDNHGSLSIKHGIIGHSRDLETSYMSTYRDKVREHYKCGTFRYGHLDNISLVGTFL
eukprot:TRINITY_DN549_c2_g1_i1.p1 TRINITY_DN549_c2_g1~~TRINITY_DN549_c2_g1_i1.p1  ORF type:complete len:310 (+),score=77.76 TRINITY_DN549_c2_g1_i1:118-1047(+)